MTMTTKFWIYTNGGHRACYNVNNPEWNARTVEFEVPEPIDSPYFESHANRLFTMACRNAGLKPAEHNYCIAS